MHVRQSRTPSRKGAVCRGSLRCQCLCTPKLSAFQSEWVWLGPRGGRASPTGAPVRTLMSHGQGAPGNVHEGGLLRPYRARVFLCFRTQGVALGYGIAPRWGLTSVRTEALKQRDSSLARNGGHSARRGIPRGSRAATRGSSASARKAMSLLKFCHNERKGGFRGKWGIFWPLGEEMPKS